MDKEQLLIQLDGFLKDVIENSGDEDAKQSALNLQRVVIICAAGMDEEFECLTHSLFHKAAAECIRDEFSGAAEAGRNRHSS